MKKLSLFLVLFCAGCASMPKWTTDLREMTPSPSPMAKIIVVGNVESAGEQVVLENAFAMAVTNYSPRLGLEVVESHQRVFQGDRKDPEVYQELWGGDAGDAVLLISYTEGFREKMLPEDELLPLRAGRSPRDGKDDPRWRYEMTLYSLTAKRSVWVGESETIHPPYVLNSALICDNYFTTVLGDWLDKKLIVPAPKKKK